MIQRRTPLARSTKPLKRTPLKRSTKRIAVVGKVGKRKQEARDLAKAHYFEHHGDHCVNGNTKPKTAPCQFCRCNMERKEARAHHKKPRGEGGSDDFTNFVVVHDLCHIRHIHGYHTGRPPKSAPVSREVFEVVETSEANVLNGFMVTGGAPR